MARGHWELSHWAGRDTYLLSWFGVDEDFSIHHFCHAGAGRAWWYLNFERPCERTPAGISTLDLQLDLVVSADLAHWQ
jgi:Protein of unknown function (DUF402)